MLETIIIIFCCFILIVVCLVVILCVVEFGRIVIRNIAIDAIEILARFWSAKLDVLQRKAEIKILLGDWLTRDTVTYSEHPLLEVLVDSEKVQEKLEKLLQ